MFIESIELNSQTYNLLPPEHSGLENYYTVILGKNGCGKSELLRETISSIIRARVFDQETETPYRDILDRFLTEKYKSLLSHRSVAVTLKLKLETSNALTIYSTKSNAPRMVTNFKGETIALKDENYRYNFKLIDSSINKKTRQKFEQSKIIATSESPYIKFPELKTDGLLNYHYLHHKETIAKERPNWDRDTLAPSRVQELTLSMLRLLSNKKHSQIAPPLEFVGLGNNVRTEVKLTRMNLHTSNERILESLLKHIEEVNNESAIEPLNLEAVSEKSLQLINLLKQQEKSDQSFNSFASESKLIELVPIDSNIDYMILLLLIEAEIIALVKTEFSLPKREGEWLDAVSLSSGQLCVLNLIIGINSRIENGSIVFIDEPEISLHPEWQADLITFMNKQFSKNENCHFILATHSPHVIANLSADNSTVVAINKSNEKPVETISGTDVVQKSADMLLALLFKTPGYKNEYLLRVMMTAFSKLVDDVELTAEDIEAINLARGIESELRDDDPVAYLINKTVKLYGNYGD